MEGALERGHVKACRRLRLSQQQAIQATGCTCQTSKHEKTARQWQRTGPEDFLDAPDGRAVLENQHAALAERPAAHLGLRGSQEGRRRRADLGGGVMSSAASRMQAS